MELGIDFKQLFSLEIGPPRDIVVGIDFGSAGLKVVESSQPRSVPTLNTYGEIQLGSYAGSYDGASIKLNVDTYTRALEDIVRAADIRGAGTVISIPTSASFTTPLTLDTVDPDEITARVPEELRNIVPLQMSEVSINWFPITKDKEKNTSTILAVAVYTKVLQQLQTIAVDVGFTPFTAELEYFAVARTLEKRDIANAIVIDLGASSAKAIFVRGGKVANLMHIDTLGGDALTRTLANTKKLSLEKAEETKRTLTAEEVRALLGGIEKKLQSLKKVIDAETSNPALANIPILLIGGGAQLAGITDILTNQLGKTVTLDTPFKMIAYPKILDTTLRDSGGVFTSALGASFAVLQKKR